MNLVRGWPRQQAGLPLYRSGGIEPSSSWPKLQLPPRIEGWPRGITPTNEAEELLEYAISWWDASSYRQGERFWKNRGISGELLDFQLGSSSTVATSNDPTWLNAEQRGYVWLSAVSFSGLRVPDEASFNIISDIDIRFFGMPNNWISGSDQTFVSKWEVDGQYSWKFYSSPAGLHFDWSTDGTTSSGVVSTISSQPFDSNSVGWIRVTLDADNGVGGSDVKFWLSGDGVTWTQYGDTVTTLGSAALFLGTSNIQIGAQLAGTGNLLGGRVYAVQVLDGIDGITALDIDCDVLVSGGQTSFSASSGQSVSILRSSSSGPRKTSVGVPSKKSGGRDLFVLGNDDYFEIPSNTVWQHQLLNFDAGDSFTVMFAERHWINNTARRPIINKNQANTTTTAAHRPRWQISNGGNYALSQFTVDDSITQNTVSHPSQVPDPVIRVIFGTTTPTKIFLRMNNQNGSFQANRQTKSLVNLTPVRVGRAGGEYGSLEVYGGAVFNRALTIPEMESIISYYGGGS